MICVSSVFPVYIKSSQQWNAVSTKLLRLAMKEIYDLKPLCLSGYESFDTAQAQYEASFVEGIRVNKFMNDDVMRLCVNFTKMTPILH